MYIVKEKIYSTKCDYLNGYKPIGKIKFDNEHNEKYIKGKRIIFTFEK